MPPSSSSSSTTARKLRTFRVKAAAAAAAPPVGGDDGLELQTPAAAAAAAAAAAPSSGHAIPSPSDYRGLPARDICHTKQRISLLSDLESVDFFGLFNLSTLTLLAANARLVLENFMKYGVRTRFAFPKGWDDLRYHFPILWTLLLLHVPFFLAFFLEKYVNTWLVPRDSKRGSTLLSGLITLANGLCVLLLPPYVVRGFPDLNPLGGALLLCCSIVWGLKLWSLHHVACDTRRALATGRSFEGVLGQAVIEKFPGSLNFRDFYCFMVMPTMCFQFEYPRTARVRKRVLARLAAQLALGLVALKILYEQYAEPILQNTFVPGVAKMNNQQKLIHFSERLLKLSIPNLYMWLLMFVVIFHLWLNFLAELTRFGDRAFYLDWWNSVGFDEYWRKWNLPIHDFFNRHIYKPLLRRGFSRRFTVQLVFVISAIVHEYVVDVPLRTGFTGLVLLAFLVQAPLCAITAHPIFQRHRSLGNALFWVIFCFSGQPLSLLVYHYLWTNKQP